MTHNSVTLVLVVFALPLCAQNRFLVSLNPAVYLGNSENSLKTIGDKTLRWSPGFSVAYEGDSVWRMDVHVEYAYARSSAVGAMPFVVTSPANPIPIAYFGADIILSTHNLDLAVRFRAHDFLTLDLGPTISLVHRTIDLTMPSLNGTPGIHFEDRLVSYCAGANAALNIQIPLQEGADYLFFISSIKLRYLHSVWFDTRGRNLDNYEQSSILGQLGAGLGYSF